VNERNRRHWDHIRDFIVLHYKLNARAGEPFWDECRHMSIPDSLSETVALFRETGRMRQEAIEFFRASSWLAMFAGFGVLPRYYSPSVDDVPEADLFAELENMAAGIASTVATAPTHEEFIRANCPTGVPVQAAANG
jgi:tryptophan halogenase